MGCLPQHNMGHFNLCFNFGLVVMMMVQVFGCVSGGHINPAVTVAAVVYKLVSLPMSFVYFSGQLLGGVLGYGALKFVTPTEVRAKLELNFIFWREFNFLMFQFYQDAEEGFCMTKPHREVNALQAIVIEFSMTAVLILVCCGVWDPRNAKHMDSIPIKFGLTIACLAAAGVSCKLSYFYFAI
jgi:aquaporin related protein